MSGHYPTKEQAAAAAMVASDVGDWVILHEAHCATATDDGCDCHTETLFLQEDGWHFSPMVENRRHARVTP